MQEEILFQIIDRAKNKSHKKFRKECTLSALNPLRVDEN
jgi:hypothetical protein